jgi:hypothetical protein
VIRLIILSTIFVVGAEFCEDFLAQKGQQSFSPVGSVNVVGEKGEKGQVPFFVSPFRVERGEKMYLTPFLPTG